jgi:hypothetical protein
MTVWHRTPRGWRFVADQGITHARPAAASAPTVVPGHGPPAAAPPAGAPAAVVASVLAADSGFDAMAARAGFRGALEAAGDAEMRWLRPRAEPYVGLPAALAAATADSARRYSATPMRGYASAAGDLGWTWGEYQYVHPGAGRRESGHYVRVWRRDGDMRWRVLLDVDSPRPSERDE